MIDLNIEKLNKKNKFRQEKKHSKNEKNFNILHSNIKCYFK
jgi:hypothetical protein